MQRFVARENVRHLEAALSAAKSGEERRQITALLSEARARLTALEREEDAARHSPANAP